MIKNKIKDGVQDGRNIHLLVYNFASFRDTNIFEEY